LTLGLTSLHPHAIVPSILSVEGQRIVLPAFFQRGRDSPDKTRQTFTTAHRFGPTTPTRAGRLADASVDETDARRAVARVGPTSGQRRRPRRNFTILRHAIDSANSAEKALIHA